MTQPIDFLRNRVVLIGAVAFLSLASTGITIYNAADDEAWAPEASAPASPAHVQATHTQAARVWAE